MSDSTPRPHPTRLDVTALRGWLAGDDGPRLLDVREPAEFEAMHIPGAYNVPLRMMREHRTELRTHLDQVVLVCRSGMRATQAEQLLTGIGMSNVHVLDGGVLAWEQAGGPVKRGRNRWDIERQVRLVAGALVLLAVLAALVVPGAQWFAAAIGAGLVTAALTNSCLMGAMLSRLPFNRGATCDIDRVVSELAGARS
ncbi:rhodanese-like domain-containing protein [Mangrovihabitans endophyticus]|uniref:Sulfurtransferase n=1 Tax=Mangrovihabitans endophyticus TaxID=1751298 RepID=A0A8J3BUH4_9ACTN|nr:rhodanese-like domain-containing protein [Mangrovihabitans endophyticus]GGK75756.1 sulfurtransferase [Mangrovihabitans endophyticus]